MPGTTENALVTRPLDRNHAWSIQQLPQRYSKCLRAEGEQRAPLYVGAQYTVPQQTGHQDQDISEVKGQIASYAQRPAKATLL